MKFKRLFESLSDDEKLELADEIRAILEYKKPCQNLTPLTNCFNLHIAANQELYTMMSIRLINVIKRNADYITQQGWYYETVREKDLKRIRGFGPLLIQQFMEVRDGYKIYY